MKTTTKIATISLSIVLAVIAYGLLRTSSSTTTPPVVDAIQEAVLEGTSGSAGQAEKEWQHAAYPRDMSTLSATPAVNVKPVIGGIEIAVRYITRASERY
jgi:hypothetical protein